MHPAGIEAFKKRNEHRWRINSYEKEPENQQRDFEKKFKANKKAWQYFHGIPPSYLRTAIHQVMSAKMKETKDRRIEELIKDSEAGRRIKRLND